MNVPSHDVALLNLLTSLLEDDNYHWLDAHVEETLTSAWKSSDNVEEPSSTARKNCRTSLDQKADGTVFHVETQTEDEICTQRESVPEQAGHYCLYDGCNKSYEGSNQLWRHQQM